MDNSFEIREIPEGIADRFMYELEIYGTDKEKETWDNLIRSLEWLMAAAQNEKNDDSFRTLYRTLEDIAGKIEEYMPWWDKE